MKKFLFFFLIFLSTQIEIFSKTDSTLAYKKVIHKLKIEKHKLNILYFLEPTCPISQKYQAIISDLNKEFAIEEIQSIFIFPNTFSTKAETLQFANEIDKKSVKIFDSQKKITKIIGATITPEVFLINKYGKIIYQGAIDDWFYALGKKRVQASTYFLKNAINNYKKGVEINPTKTEAFGCDIEL